MALFCPNFSNKAVAREFDSLVAATGSENIAYYLWNKHEGDYDVALAEAQLLMSRATQQQQQSTTSTSLLNKQSRLSTSVHSFETSMRMSTMMYQLFPEISQEFVDEIAGGYLGEADMDAMRVLIDINKMKPDTIPHEYVHFYIEMFQDAPIVQEGIQMFGSKEALVLAIGERVVEVDAEARTWFLRFVDYLKKLFKPGSYRYKALVAELTDDFLNRKEIASTSVISGVFHLSEQKTEKKTELPPVSITEARAKLQAMAASVSFDDTDHTFIDKKTGESLNPVTKLKQRKGYDTYDAANEDLAQKLISEDARRNGTAIHAVLEGLWKGTLKASDVPSNVSTKAVEGLLKLVNRLKQDYDFVASEAILADPEHGVAGIADIILRDKKTGKYVLMDFKTKLIDYNGKKDEKGNYINAKGKKLNGFLWSTSRRFSPKSERDGYAFQTSVYRYILEKLGLPMDSVGIVPIVYGVKNDKIIFAGLSKVFGRDKTDNDNLKKDGFYKIAKTRSIQYDVDYGVFGDSSNVTDDTKRLHLMTNELSTLVADIQKKLDIQSKVLKLRRRYRTQAKDAAALLEQLQNLDELDALVKFVMYASKHLNKLSKEIEERYKKGSLATWDLNVLLSYKQISQSYDMISKISGVSHRYADLIGDENVRAIEKAIYGVLLAQLIITDAYDTMGTRLYVDSISPYINTVRHRMIQEQKEKYIKDNPRGNSESNEDYKKRVQDYLDQWEKEHEDEINEHTTEVAEMWTKVAESGFECTFVSAMFSSVLFSRDPLVQSVVKIYDDQMREKHKRMFSFKTRLLKILKEYRSKYGLSNTSVLKNEFEDLFEITENGERYLVNSVSGEYLSAQSKAKDEIFGDPNTTYEEKLDKWEDWLRINNPIYDTEAYETKLEESIKSITEGMPKAKVDKILENVKKAAKDRESWYSMYQRDFITAEVRQQLSDLMHDLNAEFRRPNPVLYKNEKYNKLMQLKGLNDPKYQLWELFNEILDQYDLQLPSSIRLNYRLPAIIKKGMERVSEDGAVSTASNMLKESISLRADDTIRGTFIDEQGKLIRQIPMYYYNSSKVSLEEQSFDLPTIFYKWLNAAEDYLIKSRLESIMLQTSNMLATRETENARTNMVNGVEQRLSSKKVNTANEFLAWLDLEFYGERLKSLGKFKIPGTETEIDCAKLIQFMLTWYSKRALSGNLVAGLNNILVGEANQLEEVFAGKYISKSAYARSTQMFLLNAASITADYNRVVPENILNKLLEYFDMFDSKDNMTLSGYMRHSIDDLGYGPNTIGEREMWTRFFIGMLMDLDAKDSEGKVIGKVFDFLSFNENNELVVDEKVANFDEKALNQFALKADKIRALMHGNYVSRFATAANASAIGKAVQSLRKWIEPGVRRRYSKRYYDEMLDTEFEGMHVTTANYIFLKAGLLGAINFVRTSVLHLEEIKHDAVKWDDLEDWQKQNIIRFTTGSIIFLAAALVATFLNPPKRKDHDVWNETEWIMKYLAYRLMTDLSFYLYPKSFTTLIKDPFSIITMAEDLINAFLQLFNPFEEYKTGKHMFKNKLVNQIAMLTPGVKQIGRAWNTSQEINAFLRMR